MTAKRALLVLLGIALAIEAVFAFAGFFLPGKTLEVFQLGDTPDTRFLGHVVAWTLFAITLVCGYALCLVCRNDRAGWGLTYLLGFWWIGIGLALAIKYGRTDNLFLDTLKGALLVGAAYASRHNGAPRRQG